MDVQNPDPDTAASASRRTFPIRTVAALTGVSAFTLRSWERRHGLINPERTARGQRAYTQVDVERIRQILALLDAGMAIGQVAGVIETEGKASGSPESTGFWARLRERMVERISAFDEPGLDTAYQEALALHPIEQVTQSLLLPLLRELGTRWLASECGIAEEHFFAVYLRNKVGARFHHRRFPDQGPKLLCACLPGERHELGQLLFALAANVRGFRTILLGADVPLGAVSAAAGRMAADAVVLSGFVEPTAAFWTEGLRWLVDAVAVPIFIGGPVCLTHRGQIVEAGAHDLGCELSMSFQRINLAIDRI